MLYGGQEHFMKRGDESNGDLWPSDSVRPAAVRLAFLLDLFDAVVLFDSDFDLPWLSMKSDRIAERLRATISTQGSMIDRMT